MNGPLLREVLRDGVLQLDKLRDEVERGLGRHEALGEAEQGLSAGEVHRRGELGHRDDAGVGGGERFVAEIRKCIEICSCNQVGRVKAERQSWISVISWVVAF